LVTGYGTAKCDRKHELTIKDEMITQKKLFNINFQWKVTVKFLINKYLAKGVVFYYIKVFIKWQLGNTASRNYSSPLKI
jgi:hypothetical protein